MSMSESVEDLFLKAVETGDFALCQTLIDEHSLDPVTVVDKAGITALHACAQFGRYSIATILISQVTALRGGEAIVTLKKWVNMQCGLGFSCLHYAVGNDNLMLANSFVAIGAEIAAKTKLGMTVMHLAARGNSPLCLAFFHEKHSLSWSEVAIDGLTPMHEAAHHGSDHALLLLIAWDTQRTAMSAKDIAGNTPLHVAISSGHSRTAAILMQSGADLHVANNAGDSAFSLAASSEDSSIRKLVAESRLLVACGVVSPRNYQHKKWGLVVLAETWVLLSNFATFVCCLPSLEFVLLLAVLLLAQQTLFFLTVFANPQERQKTSCSLANLYQWNAKHRVCPFCRIARSSRSVHCPICDQCTRRFDHHCPWVNNCVGAANLAFFLGFLACTCCDMVAITVVTGHRLLSEWSSADFLQVCDWLNLALIGVYMGISVAVGLLVFLQTQNFIQNRTTFERFSKRSESSLPTLKRNPSCVHNCGVMCSRSDEPLQEPLIVQQL